MSERDDRRAAEAGGQGGRPIVVVLGMHRSGTSLCADVLGLLGVDMADEASPGRGNERGHFERWGIVACHDAVLALFDRCYGTPTHDLPLPPGWWADPGVRPIKGRIAALLAPLLARPGPFGFKDPRTARLLPLWRQLFAELDLQPRYVVCLRDPAHAAASLLTRDGLDAEAGELMALDYLVDILRYTRGRDRCFVRYDDWLRDPASNVARLSALLGPLVDVDATDLDAALGAVVRPEMNRSGRPGAAVRHPLVRDFYGLVDRLALSAGGDAALDEDIERFTRHYAAFRPLLARLGARIAASTSAQTDLALRAAAAEAALSGARSEVEAAERDKAALQARVDALAAALRDSEGERIRLAEARAEALSDLAAERTALDAARAEAAGQGRGGMVAEEPAEVPGWDPVD